MACLHTRGQPFTTVRSHRPCVGICVMRSSAHPHQHCSGCPHLTQQRNAVLMLANQRLLPRSSSAPPSSPPRPFLSGGRALQARPCAAQLRRGMGLRAQARPEIVQLEEKNPSKPSERSHFWSAAMSSSKTMALAQLSQWQGLSWPQEANKQDQEVTPISIQADITPFLEPVSLREMKHIRKLSNLCGLSYKTDKVNEQGLKRRHDLDLVVTSWSYNPAVYEAKSAAASMAEGDGMAASFTDVRQRYLPDEEDLPSGAKQHMLAMQPASVAAKLTEAAMAASAAATALAGFTVSRFSGNSAGGSNRLAPVPTIQHEGTATEPSPAPPAPTRYLSSAASKPEYSCPSEWYACDDSKEQLRIFVIQGSNSIDHWKLNLAFDPVLFEDPALGVLVHRGVYEAAAVLYDKLLPLVYEHLESSPFARVTFTGHSIGGCMAMLLMLMFVKRGVLKSNNIAPVYTFGAPSVFCAGLDVQETGCEWGDAEAMQAMGAMMSQPASPACECTADGPSCLLASLGLKDSTVRHVIMHRDIVPRAFTCDYRGVADIIRNWGPAFRSLEGTGRKHLYSVCGTLLVLQPARQHAFVSNNPDHPLLPPGPGLYLLKEPRALPPSSHSSSNTPGPAPAAALSGAQQLDQPSGMQPAATRVPASARAAVLELMDNPHPLDMLTDPAAYMAQGQISRFHNPDHLTQALGALIHLTTKNERRHD